MAAIVKVKVSNDEQHYSHKFNVYDEGHPIVLSKSCERLAGMVQTTVDEFKGVVDDVRIVATFQW